MFIASKYSPQKRSHFTRARPAPKWPCIKLFCSLRLHVAALHRARQKYKRILLYFSYYIGNRKKAISIRAAPMRAIFLKKWVISAIFSIGSEFFQYEWIIKETGNKKAIINAREMTGYLPEIIPIPPRKIKRPEI